MLERPRRNRISSAVRHLVRETTLAPSDLVLPLFIKEGTGEEPIASMPGVFRLGLDRAITVAAEAATLGIRAVALFPVIPDTKKDQRASAGTDPDGLVPRAIRMIKDVAEEMAVIADVAMDPYSSDGHDGLVRDGRILNDESLPILAEMAAVAAKAGADVIAPSDMMDGRIGHIRTVLDSLGYQNTLICSYCAKYASAFYGPFRDALDSAPRFGDKLTYQMDPANRREALREARLDEAEGADWLLVKPGLPYLDVLADIRRATTLPLAAYHVSGEYAMLRAASERGWIDYDRCLLESLLAFRRAGADLIFTYGALDAARALAGDPVTTRTTLRSARMSMLRRPPSSGPTGTATPA